MEKKRKKPRKQVPVPKKITPKEQEEAEVAIKPWMKKWEAHRNSIIAMGVVVILILGVAAIHINNVTQTSELAWQSLGEAWTTITTDRLLFTDWKVQDLGSEYVKIVEKTVGDKEGLPDYIKKEYKEIEAIPVSMLPTRLKDKMIHKYLKEKMELEAEAAKTIKVYPWIEHCLSQIYFQEDDPQKALDCYKTIVSQYAAHPLAANLNPQEREDWEKVQKEVEWRKQKNVTEAPRTIELKEEGTKKAILTTSKGKVTIELFEKTCPLTTAHFIQLVQSGFYNGMNFYKVTPEEVFTGCPLGNGKGDPGYTKMGEMKDIILQRGYVAMEDTEGDEGKIGSRFFIFKKYPWFGSRENYAFLGRVTDGLQVLEQLTQSDVLLDVTIQS